MVAGDYLFSSGGLDDALRATVDALLNGVDQWDTDQLLAQSETEIVEYLVAKYSVRCPILLRDSIEADIPREVTRRIYNSYGRPQDDPLTRVVVHVPFEGDEEFFRLQPSTFGLNPPKASVNGDELLLTHETRELDGNVLRNWVDRALGDIEQYLSHARPQAEAHNASLPSVADHAVRQRKERLLRDRSAVASLGFPIRRKADAPSVSVPVRRRRVDPSPKAPARVTSHFQPEPELASDDYEEALRVLVSAARQLERIPDTAATLDENGRRNLLLVGLNTQFEGNAAGEVFNSRGKTDILIRVGDRNVFIGECKIWRGDQCIRAGDRSALEISSLA
jgi:hypothetical protein